MIFKQFLSSFGGERVTEGEGVIVTPPRLSETGERREAERVGWSSLFVCVGSFSVLLNCLSQIEVRR